MLSNKHFVKYPVRLPVTANTLHKINCVRTNKPVEQWIEPKYLLQETVSHSDTASGGSNRTHDLGKITSMTYSRQPK
jgi:hypothetical protein